jgi:beta-ribofuranosylaminobenzene 5'-phosphate synthase
LMTAGPGIEISIAAASAWTAEGLLAARALQFAQEYCAKVGIGESFAVHVVSAGPQHVGLGTGTQLGLAIARGIAELTHQPARDAVTLARQVGRGKRSAIGVHGFDHGGFLIEGGKRLPWKISPLVFRHDFPEDWQIVLITPRELSGSHGSLETDAFAELADCEADERATDVLCRLALMGMMPSLKGKDLVGFNEALSEFNCRAGEMFQAVQGGVYAHPRIAEIVKFLQQARVGSVGVGQSSWGPTVFAVAAADTTGMIRRRLEKFGVAAEEICVVTACNHGAVVSTEY